MSRSLFYRLFPPPKFLKMPTIGIDISDTSVHCIRLKKSKEGLIISNFEEKDVPKGTIESGEIKNSKELVRILSSIKRDFGTSFVSVSLPEQHAYLLKLRIPKMKQSEIRSNLELQLEDNVPISVKEAIFDYDIVHTENTVDQQMEVELSVLPKNIVENYYSVFKKAGMEPLSFEIESQAIARSVVPYGDPGTFMIMDFGRTRTGISIVSNGITRFTSTVDIGGMSLTKAIERTLKISFEEAEEMKKEKGVIKREENEDLFLTMMSIIGVLKDEITKHYIYWDMHKDQYGKKRPKIEKVILCGGNANLAGLSEYLSSGLRMNVELANVMTNVNSFDRYIPEINFKESLHYSTAIGLALRYAK